MRRSFSTSVLVVCAALALAACEGEGAKIGSTVKGTRIAVLEQSKSVKADSDLSDSKPQIADQTPNANWPQAGYDSLHQMPNAALADKPQEIWSASIGEGSSSDYKLLARPVVNNNIVFTMDAQGGVRAFDVKDGDRKWSLDTAPEDADTDAIGGGLAADGSSLYVTTGFGEVMDFEADSGKMIWRKRLQNPIRAAPTVAESRVYAVTIDNRLSAMNILNGEEQWHHAGIAENATLMGASNPAVEGDNVVIAYSSGEIYNLRTENGHVTWNYSLSAATSVGALPAIADIRGLPVIDRGHIIAVSHSGRMASIDQRTGDREWEIDVGSINTPVVSGDAIFVLSNQGQLIAIKRDSGRIMWVHELQHLEDPEDRDSDPVFWVGPVLAGNRLWLGNSMGLLASFSTDDGSSVSAIDLGEPIYISPVIANGVMYAITDNGRITALK